MVAGPVVTILVLEAFSHVAILIVGPRLDERIRRRADIYEEQTRRIERILTMGQEGRDKPDCLLGWRYRAGFRDEVDRLNSQGLRSDREYSVTPRPGVVRIAAFGDSFVYCNEVSNDQCWSHFIEVLYPGIEVLNYGVGGYGTDQAYLQYLREGDELRPHIVLIGFTPVDLRRTINVYRRFISTLEHPLAKPRFLLGHDGSLTLLPNPLGTREAYKRLHDDPGLIIRLGKHDRWYEPAIYENPAYDLSATVRLAVSTWIRLRRRYLDADRLMNGSLFNTTSEAFRIQVVLLDTFVAAVESSGARPVILILPDRYSITAARNGEQTIYAPLVDVFKGKGTAYLDVLQAFLAEGEDANSDEWFMSGGHYSSAANRIAAWLGHRMLVLGQGMGRPD